MCEKLGTGQNADGGEAWPQHLLLFERKQIINHTKMTPNKSVHEDEPE